MWQAIGSNNLSQTDEQYILYLVNANSGISYHCTYTYIYILYKNKDQQGKQCIRLKCHGSMSLLGQCA